LLNARDTGQEKFVEKRLEQKASQLGLPISGLSEKLLAKFSSQAAHAMAHWRETVQVRLGELLLEFFKVRQT
jgi:hypothetical protein